MEIKIRESRRDIVKTIDRAGLMAGSFKDISMRTRDDLVDIFSQDKGSYEYAPDVAGHAVSEAGSFAVRGAADVIHQSGGINAGMQEDIGALEITPIPEQNVDRIPRVFSERSSKSLLDRREALRMGNEEILSNGKERIAGEQIRWRTTPRSAGQANRNAAKSVPKRYEPPDTSNLIRQRKQAFAMKRLQEKRSAGTGFWRLGAKSGGRQKERAVERMGRLLKDAVASAKALFSSLTIGGMAALIIVIIMVIFGSVLSFNEDGSYILGIGDETIVEVARAQLGNQGGEKFWKWYGFKSRVDWCAIFCSWCADQCGYLEAGTYPKFAVVGDGANWFKERHRWAGRGYTPKPGDLIFFDPEHDGVYNHVGIVESCDGKTITTIEGNSGDACKRHTYPVGSSQIVGFGISIVKSTMPMSGNYSIMQARMVAWAKMIAADNKYSYKTWTSSNRNTDKCPICHPGSGNGWNCIGFVFAVWHHGGGLNNRCDCSAISNGVWESMLTAKSDAKASKIASDRLGIPVIVIRNDGKTIPQSALMPGDILGHFHGGTFWHTTFYIGDGKIAHSKSSGSKADQITISNVIDCKVVIRYAGAPQSQRE